MRFALELDFADMNFLPLGPHWKRLKAKYEIDCHDHNMQILL